MVLLIIMMVVAPMLDSSGLKLAVPTAGPSEDVTEEPKVIRIQINEQSQYAVVIDGEQEAIQLPFLANKLRELKKDYPEGVIIDTHPESTHESLAMAMDSAQAAGINKVAVVSMEGEPLEEGSGN